MSDPVRASFEKLRREAMAKQESETDRALTRINEQVEELDIRWTDDRLREALAPVIASSIREAGRKQPEAVARAMSPHVIGTVRTEIKNSEEAIIDVLHPRLGRLIRQGIATAVDELRQQVDEALPLDRWIADMKARLTGAPRLGALLKDPSPFIIHEAYLIERRSGRLLAREVPRDIETGEGADEDLFAGMIAALDSFARDALAEEGGGTLRRIETDAGSLYLRASATRIIALRTTGNPVPDIEQRMDLFLETLLEQAGEDGDTVAAFDTTPLLQGPEASAGAGGAAATTGAFGLIARGVGAIAAVICAINGHALIEEHRRDRAVEAVASVLDEAPAYLGYPLSAGFAPARDEVLVRGLAPDEAAREALLARLAEVPLAFPLVTQVPVAGRRLEP